MYKDNLTQLFDSYKTARGLTNILKSRMKDGIPDNCLNEIRAMLDHVARCYKAEQEHKKGYSKIAELEISKADGHLRRLHFDCFKQLNIIFHDSISRIERRKFCSRWLYISGGSFWRTYTGELRLAVKNVIEAKKNESYKPDKALDCYAKALHSYTQVEKDLIINKKKLFGSRICHWFEFDAWVVWGIITLLLSILSTVITQKLLTAFLPGSVI